MKITEILQNFLLRLIIGQLTPEKLKRHLESFLVFLDNKTQQTENIVDDWMVEALYDIVNNGEKLNVIYSFLMSFLTPQEDGVCKALPTDAQWNQLGTEVAQAGEEDGVCKAVDIAQIILLLQTILPPIIEIYNTLTKK